MCVQSQQPVSQGLLSKSPTHEQPHSSDLRNAGHHSHREGVERSMADQQADQ